MNRKEFFRAILQNIAEVCNELIEVNTNAPILKPRRRQRPPGASKNDHEFIKLCTGCDACMIACPVNIIMIENMQLRHPVIYPDEGPCLHCSGYPCIQSCPTGALSLPFNKPS